MTPNEYQNAALRTAPKYPEEVGKIPQLINGLMGLNGEAGEAIDILKKHLFHHHKLDKGHLAKELGDIAWYLAVTADALGYTLEDILKMNIDKLMARYPEGFDANRSQHRDPNDI
ncbi:MAG: nucleoside triphosphate pyrophosphohydrolase family protein [Oscillospiraceae bacterium]|nr:nucleoside triphosphate pyrophosphohydrolase family protein [Oscillospiraceae bacterium]